MGLQADVCLLCLHKSLYLLEKYVKFASGIKNIICVLLRHRFVLSNVYLALKSIIKIVVVPAAKV